MQRRQTNSTRYDPRARKLFWRVEWRFPAAAAAAAPAPDTAAVAAAAVVAPNAVEASPSPGQPATEQQQQQQPKLPPQQPPAAAAAAGGAAAAVVHDGKVDEEFLLSKVLGRHLEYRQGCGAQALQLRAYREAGLEALTVLMRKERCPVSGVTLGNRIDMFGEQCCFVCQILA
jgi:hypothetical protein